MRFESLDFIYTPSHDVAADTKDFTDVLGGTLIFAIEDGGIRVSMIELTAEPPRILLTDHVEGDRPILVYRVADIGEAEAELGRLGWQPALRWRSRRGRSARSGRRAGTGSRSIS